MNLKHLEYIIKIAECGSITQAAEQLFVSQPSLSKSVDRLERRYDIQIFTRKPRGVELTLQGRKFIHHAQALLTSFDAFECRFLNDEEPVKSRLFLATQQLDFVYDLLLEIHSINQRPKFHYNLIETDRSEVVQLVLNGDVDLGIIVRSSADPKTFLWHSKTKQLDIHVIDQASTFACVGPKSPFYERNSIKFSEAQTCFHIVLDVESQVKRDLCFDSTKNHFNLNNIVFFNTTNACESFLLRTDALLFVSKWTMGCFRHPQLHMLEVRPDCDYEQPPINELLWLKRTKEPLTPTEGLFLRLLYHHFNKPHPQLNF